MDRVGEWCTTNSCAMGATVPGGERMRARPPPKARAGTAGCSRLTAFAVRPGGRIRHRTGLEEMMTMGFAEAVRTVLSKYATFSGRARRSEYWWFALFSVLASMVAGILDVVLGTDFGDTAGNGLIGTILALALFLPSLAVAIR